MRLYFSKIARSMMVLLVVTFAHWEARAQADVVTGQVKDERGETLPGANVVIKGSNVGTTTDIDGRYSIRLQDASDVLVFSFVGYQSHEIPVAGKSVINVTLQPDVRTMDEVVVIGYGTQQKEKVTAAISQISGEELLKAPTANITSHLGGRVPGVISLQTSGQPGSDGADVLVRGSNAKYVVDGVERSFSEIDPNEIETVTVLKDAASASVYGLDANSVIIITTKRGKEGVSKISATASHGISTNAVMLDMLDGPGYAYWYNKALELDGDAPIFTADHVAKMLNGDDSDGWGNTDWYKKTFDVGKTTSYNINATGGTDYFRYFVSLGNYNQKGNVKGFDFNRLNLRSNIDALIAKNLDLTFNVAARVEERDRPGFSGAPADWNNIPQQALRAHPYVPASIDGVPVSTRTSSSYVSPLAASDLSGYHNGRTEVLQTNLALRYKLPFVQGLSVKFLAAYDISNTTSKGFSKPYYTFVANTPTATTTDITYSYSHDARGNSSSLVEGLSRFQDLTTNSSIEYERSIGKHNITALALMETVQRDRRAFGAYGYDFDIYELDELDFANLEDVRTKVTGSSGQERRAGFLGRVAYDYANKYHVLLSYRYDGSYVFGGMVPGKRWSPFPAMSLGWTATEESWFPASSYVNYLKVRGSIGLTGTATVPPYYFLNTLSYLDDPAVALNGQARRGLITSRPANVNLTWEKSLQYNLGFDATVFNNWLDVELDVFYKYVYDMLSGVTGSFPDSYGGYVPGYVNANKQDHKGFEITLSHRRQIGDFSYRVGVNGTYTKRRWLLYTEAENTPDWLKLTGKEVGSQVGFIAAGLFQSQEEIENSATIIGKDVRVGDIKYVDVNGDGVISYEQDRGYFGKSNMPKFVGGVNVDLGWKGFDLSMLWQGAAGRDVALTGLYPNYVMDHTNMTRPFYHGSNSPVYLVENSWRPDHTDAEFPRLSIVPASSNNAYSSTFWYRNGNYLRLKTMQIGYTLPSRVTESIGMNAVRVYAEGQNLLTFSELTKYNIDPEQPNVSNGYYPQQRVFAMGVKLTF